MFIYDICIYMCTCNTYRYIHTRMKCTRDIHTCSPHCAANTAAARVHIPTGAAHSDVRRAVITANNSAEIDMLPLPAEMPRKGVSGCGGLDTACNVSAYVYTCQSDV